MALVNLRLRENSAEYVLQLCAGVYQNEAQDDERRIFELADSALYEAKQTGKARFVIYRAPDGCGITQQSAPARWPDNKSIYTEGTTMDEVTLTPITEDNFLDAFRLKLAEGQEAFVSHPIRSLAQAYVYRDQCQPFGIYHGGQMVGYVMVIYDYDIPEYDIWHMMIDESCQGHGYGTAALQECIAYIRTKPFGDSGRVCLTCSKDNGAALHIYAAMGFCPTGAADEDEIELVLNLT